MSDHKKIQENLKLIEKSLSIASLPKSIILETTSACNFKCSMCHNSDMTRDKKNIKEELWDITLEEIAKENLDTEIWLTFYGEAMILFDKVLYGLKKANSLGFKKIFLNSNGSLMSVDKFKQLADNGLSKLIYSVDAFTKETYESIRIGGNRDEVYKNILDTVELNKSLDKQVTIEVQLIKMDENADEIEDFIKFWSSYGVVTKIKSYLNWTEFNGDYKGITKEYDRIACPWIFNTFPILANGDAVICGCDYDGKKIYGNVFEKSIKQIWKEKEKDLKHHLNHEFDKIPQICKECTDWFVEPSFLIE